MLLCESFEVARSSTSVLERTGGPSYALPTVRQSGSVDVLGPLDECAIRAPTQGLEGDHMFQRVYLSGLPNRKRIHVSNQRSGKQAPRSKPLTDQELYGNFLCPR